MSVGSQRRQHGRRDTGAVAIEFALLMAFLPLTVLAVGIVDYGEFMEQSTNLAAVVRGATEYARGQVVQGSPLPQPSDLSNLLNPAVVFTLSSFCTCADNTSIACPGTGDPNPCAASPPANGDIRVLKYVGVSGSQTYTPIISATWSFPPSVNARAVLRAQ
jgi:Flp pilus assembly protein TadG